MTNIFLFYTSICITTTVTIFINLRMWQAYKKGLDVKAAFKSTELSAARKLELQDAYNEILDRG